MRNRTAETDRDRNLSVEQRRDLTNAGLIGYTMQSIFCPASRRNSDPRDGKSAGRDGGQKMDCANPPAPRELPGWIYGY